MKRVVVNFKSGSYEWEARDPGLDAVARVVGPALGGALLGALYLPWTFPGFLMGGLLGMAVGILRNRELAQTRHAH